MATPRGRAREPRQASTVKPNPKAPIRYQAPQDTWIPVFLKMMRNTGNVRMSCEAAEITRAGAYKRRDSDPAFADAWDTAKEESTDLLEARAFQWATEGIPEPVIFKGQVMMRQVGVDVDGTPVYAPLVVHKVSEGMLKFLLEGNRPEKYRTRVTVDGHMTHEVRSELDQRIDDLLGQFGEGSGPAGPGPGSPGDAGRSGSLDSGAASKAS